MVIDSKVINKFFLLLNDNNVKYILIKNINNELPFHLPVNKDIDILVHSDSVSLFEKVMHENKFLEIIHPKGRENGWLFLYNIPICKMYKHIKYGLEVDVSPVLCTKSVNMNAWLPLDRLINESIWENRIWDAENNWWIMDEYNLVVYLVVRSVFEKNRFEDNYIYEIEKRKDYLYSDECRKKLECVFFKFTDTLLKLINEKKYNDILHSYLNFCDY